VTDLLFRMAYRAAYRLMRVYWMVRRPNTHGALVALWHDGRILLVRNSYVPYHSLPGGYVRTTESGRDAAVRELLEETGLRALPEQLQPAIDEWHDWEGKREHIEIFELDVARAPAIQVDNREVVAAEWFTPDRALDLDLFGPLRKLIQRRAGSSAAPPS
jgi:8-oxo-dGTP diphosphatase